MKFVLIILFQIFTLIFAKNFKENFSECGIETDFSIKLHNRVNNGQNLEQGQQPWLVFLNVLHWQCAGTIISPYHILTAAHCVFNQQSGQQLSSKDIFIQAGNIQIKYVGKSKLLTIKKFDIHPKFQFYPYRGYDFAILTLKTPLQFNENQRRICLATKFNEKNYLARATVAGWGLNIKKEKFNPNAEFNNQLQFTNSCDYYGFNETNSFCAGGKGAGTEPGDSGSPLMIQSNNTKKWFQVGITSGGEVDDGTIFSRVSFGCKWIQKITNKQASCMPIK